MLTMERGGGGKSPGLLFRYRGAADLEVLGRAPSSSKERAGERGQKGNGGTRKHGGKEEGRITHSVLGVEVPKDRGGKKRKEGSLVWRGACQIGGGGGAIQVGGREALEKGGV